MNGWQQAMGYRRAVATAHAEKYWWRPCEDGLVWIKNDVLWTGRVPPKMKKPGYGLAFLWYSRQHLEGLFWMPASKIADAKDKSDTDFPDAVMIASYHDNPALEPVDYFATHARPPFYGLNDCTHFTSECLIKGGFAVTNEHARRGAPDLYSYLYYHSRTKVLASEVDGDAASNVISAGLLKDGDVIVYTNRSDHQRHHGVLHLGGGTIAMHTYHQFNVGWDDAGGDGQLYSFFHISDDDDYKPPMVARWSGWWQITSGAEVRYSYFSANGHMHTTSTRPTNTKSQPRGSDYWFVVTPGGMKMSTCVRAKGIVEELTLSPAAVGGGPMTATGKRVGGGPLLNAVKL